MSALAAVLFDPFADFEFMRRALVACFALALGSAPVGVFLVLRRMSLMGDALSHAVLPGAAVGFVLFGLSLPAMGAGGMIAGLLVALLSGAVSRLTPQREDASFAAFYLISLAAGVLIISARGSNVDLVHVLFGTILAVDDPSLILIAAIATASLLGLAVLYRALVAECFDSGYLRSVGGRGGAVHVAFLTLVVVNLIAGFQALGTLMAVGLMMLPAAASRFWAREVWSLCLCAIAIAGVCGYAGLVISFQFGVPSGPAIVLCAGVVYGLSVLFGRRGGLAGRLSPRPHFES